MKSVTSLELKTWYEAILAGGVTDDSIRKAVEHLPFDLSNPDARHPISVYVQLAQQAGVLTNNPLFAFQLGQSCLKSEQGIVHSLAASCENYQDAFLMALRFARLNSDLFDLSLTTKGDLACLSLTFTDLTYYCAQALEFAVSRAFFTFRGMWGDDFRPAKVCIDAVKPQYYEAFEHTMNCDIQWLTSSRSGHPESCICFNADVLYRKLPSYQPYLKSVLIQHAQKLLDQLSSRDSLTDRVKARMLARLTDGSECAETIAKDLAMSRSTLHRRLKDAHTSYKILLEDVQKAVADYYLSSSDLPITDVALLCGFSESSAFSRAAKRWFGCTPLQKRSQQKL